MENSHYNFPLGDLNAALEVKFDLVQSFERELSKSKKERAKKDYHGRKLPFPHCGMTVHPAIGCSSSCLYCYVPSHRVRVTPLSGKEMAYSLLLSPFFFPGQHGTFLALGSITDPFLPNVRERTFEIIKEIQVQLGNPLQIATKQILPISAFKDLANEFFSRMCLLVSLSSLESAKELEPHNAPAEDRLEFINAIRRAGGSPFIFLRPIIPGVTNKELNKLIAAFKESSNCGVVLGSLRLNQTTLELLKIKIDISEITKRLPSPNLGKGFQYIYTNDLKQEFSDQIRAAGLSPFHSACCANAASHRLPCVNACWKNSRICTNCWNQCSNHKMPEIPDSTEIQRFIRRCLGKQAFAMVDQEKRMVYLQIKASPAVRMGAKRTLETLLRAQVVVSPKKLE
ncbi:MAG: radical SAM protein [Candidatus Hodarchaeota archaeon]